MRFNRDTIHLYMLLHMKPFNPHLLTTRIEEPVLHLRGGGNGGDDDAARTTSPDTKRARRRRLQHGGHRQPATATANLTNANAASNLGARSPQQIDVGTLTENMSHHSPFQAPRSDSTNLSEADDSEAGSDQSESATGSEASDPSVNEQPQMDTDYSSDEDDLDEDTEEEAVIEDLIHSSPSSYLESSIDEDEDDSKPSANNESVKYVDTTTFDERDGEFKRRFDYLKEKRESDYGNAGLPKAIQHLVDLVERRDFTSYSKEELEALFNDERGDIGQALKKALRDKGLGHLARYVNLGSKLSVLTAIVFYLHYAPSGSKVHDKDDLNYCRDDQCCVATKKSKLLNFLINEKEYGPNAMEDWRFGGKTDVDVNERIAIVDLIPFLLDKTDSDSEMRSQYIKVARWFGLDNYHDLMVISYCLLKMHLILHQKTEADKLLQIHVASAATAKYVFGLKGTDKYLRKISSQTFCLTFGFHPQGWLMGIGKNNAIYPKALLEIMARHLVGVYQSVHPKLANMQSRIFEIFGCKQASLNMGMYNYSAKQLNDNGLLNLDTKLGPDPEVATVREALMERAVSIDVISFLLKEMEGTSTLSLIMDRMRRFQARQRLPYIASLLPKDVTSLDSLPAELKCIIDAISSTLKKPTERVFQSLLKYQAGQLQKTLLHRLGKKYNNAEGEEDGLALEDGRDAAASLWDDEDFNTYCRITNHDPAVAMQKVKNTAMSYNDTFWRNFEELKIYLDMHPGDIRTIEGKNIVTIKKDRLDRNNRVYSYLYNWLYAMNGYSTHGNYGFVAHQRPGSVEYEALSELGVSFDARLNEEALNERLRSSIVERESFHSGLMDF